MFIIIIIIIIIMFIFIHQKVDTNAYIAQLN